MRLLRDDADEVRGADHAHMVAAAQRLVVLRVAGDERVGIAGHRDFEERKIGGIGKDDGNWNPADILAFALEKCEQSVGLIDAYREFGPVKHVAVLCEYPIVK